MAWCWVVSCRYFLQNSRISFLKRGTPEIFLNSFTCQGAGSSLKFPMAHGFSKRWLVPAGDFSRFLGILPRTAQAVTPMTRVSGDQWLNMGMASLRMPKFGVLQSPFFFRQIHIDELYTYIIIYIYNYVYTCIYVYIQILLIAFCDPMLGGAVGIIRKNSYGVAPYYSPCYLVGLHPPKYWGYVDVNP